MKDHQKANAIATERVQILSPLLTEGLDAAKARQLRDQICSQTGLSERTLRRYLAQYREEGYDGLKPKSKAYRECEDAIPIQILEQAILLRREVPGRSIAQIIQILEWEGLIQPGQIKRSTLQEKLAAKGYSTRHMRMYNRFWRCHPALSKTAPQPAGSFGHQVWSLPAYWSKWREKAGLSGCVH